MFPARKGDQSATAPEEQKKSTKSSKMVSVLKQINLEIQDGEFMVLVGPSGCGKSTLLRLIAGLDTASGGIIQVGDRQVNDLPPKDRDIAMVFQSYALYPHLSVFDNLAFGLRRTGFQSGDAGFPGQNTLEGMLVGATKKLPKAMRYQSSKEKAIATHVQQVAGMLQIESLLSRLPKELSGGQKQRVALGRAMARNPQVFLMDEPLSNLDAKLRGQTRAQIVKLQRQLGTTTIYVTHDQTEAMTMGDRIAVMNEGVIQQLATPLELYNNPTNRFVASFIGSPPMNFIRMTVDNEQTLSHPTFKLTLPNRWSSTLEQRKGQSVDLGIRPEHLSLAQQGEENIPASIDLVEALGNETYISVSLRNEGNTIIDGQVMMNARIKPEHQVNIDDPIHLAIEREKVHLFDSQTGEALH